MTPEVCGIGNKDVDILNCLVVYSPGILLVEGDWDSSFKFIALKGIGGDLEKQIEAQKAVDLATFLFVLSNRAKTVHLSID